MKNPELRGIPSVDKVLLALGETDLPRAAVVAIVRRQLAQLRSEKAIPEFDAVVSPIRGAIKALELTRIRPVINGTGILIHTNFGRAPLGHAVIENLSTIASHYNNLEYGLADGGRGNRAAYLEQNLALLCGAESATVVNNNAAALVLILRHLCQAAQFQSTGSRTRESKKSLPKNEVVISRGELVQIGGGFRIPEILEASGARLREVGTTNKTSLADYARAISARTALLLKVHRSNFFMSGFVESPATKDISQLARKKRIPFVEDLGSGAMIETQMVRGLEHEPTPAEVLRSGADLVCFSGDKLLGGPQAGLIAGKAKLIAALKREPFFRALRCDKLILSALETVVDSYLRAGGEPSSQGASRLESDVPILAMLRLSNDELRARAARIIAALHGLPLCATVGTGRSQVGGGTLPRSVIDSITLDLIHRSLKPQQFAARLRENYLPVIGYVAREKLKLDLRTIFPQQDAEVVAALRAVCSATGPA